MIVCVCEAVSESTLRRAIAAGCKNLGKLRTSTRAGTDCGQCTCELKQLLREARARQPLLAEAVAV